MEGMAAANGARPGALTGVVLALAIATWWLGSTRLALDHGTDAGRSAALALRTLWLARGMALALLCVRTGALYGWRRGAIAGLVLLSPAWPLVALAWSASATPLLDVVAAELLLIAAAAAVPSIGVLVRRALPRADVAVVAGTGIGTVLAAALWLASGSAYLPLSP
jgi:hypothetical protein